MIENTLPPGFTIRPPTLDDIPMVNELIRTYYIANYGTSRATEEQLRTLWTIPGFQLATDAWVVISPEGTIVAYATVDTIDEKQFAMSGCLHPEYRNKGIGTYLIHLVEERTRQIISNAPTNAIIRYEIASVDEAGKQLLTHEGYSIIRYTLQMEIEMSEMPSEPQWSEGVSVRQFQKEQDERAVHAVDEETFADHWNHTPLSFELWQHWMIQRDTFDPTLWFLATDGNEIAGICLCVIGESGEGWVDSLGVRRPWRRKGLGMALLRHAFKEFYQRNIHKVGLTVDAQSLTGATRLYERAGMHTIRRYDLYEKELC